MLFWPTFTLVTGCFKFGWPGFVVVMVGLAAHYCFALKALYDLLVLLYRGVHVLGKLQEVSLKGDKMLFLGGASVVQVGVTPIMVIGTFGLSFRHPVFCQRNNVASHRRC